MTIRTDYSKTFSYARMQNGIPAVRSVIIKNTEKEVFHDVRLTLSFDPAFATDYESVISELSKGKITLDNIKVMPSATYLANLTEQVEGVMTLTLATADAEVAKETYPVSLLPYDFWEGVNDAPELLAAYVLPNHPAIRPILQKAAGKLLKWTGSPSLDGYQSGDVNRSRMQMAAIYEAIADEKLCYVNPPASFAEQGQRVRLPEDILSGRLATCLDAALLYAGCLEAVGLRPLVVINDGHAYAGGWLVEKSSPYPVNDDPALLRKCGADGINETLLVETTGFLKGNDFTFDEAVQTANGTLAEIDSFRMFIDVCSARNLGIRPIPQRVLTPEGYIIDEATVYKPDIPDKLDETDEIDIDGPARVDKHTIWERKLLDLSLRNNLVNLHVKKAAIQLIGSMTEDAVEMLENGAAFNIFGIPQGWTGDLRDNGIFREPGPDSPMHSFAQKEMKDRRFHSFRPEEQTFLQLDAIRLEARHYLEENGANTLYLTAGALKWFDDDGETPHFAPILLIPVEITKSTWAVKWTGEDITANLTLLEMLRQQHSLSIPGLDSLPEKDGHIAVRKVMNIIRRAVMDKKGWDVEDLLFLGNFTFNKFIIWNDIHTHRDMLDSSPAVKSLVEGRLKVKDINQPEGSIDSLCPSAKILQPLSADSSQLRAIRDAVAGRSFVMHGPPGTGKSQTITNIIANSLYNGRRVLFVSEKKAALEVVQKRLEEIGLDPFCLELHSNKARKSYVLEKLDQILSIQKVPAPESFADDAARMDEKRNALNVHAESVNKVYPSGHSLYDCVSRYILLPEDLPARRIPASVLRKLNVAGFKELQATVRDYVTAISHSGIKADCQLFDLPVLEYSPELKERLYRRFSDLLAKTGIPFWWDARKLEKELGRPIGVKMSSAALSEVRGKVERWRDNLSELKMYAIYARQKARLCGLGLNMISEEYEAGNVAPDQLEDFFLKCFYRSYASHILDREKGLGIFCGELFESFIRKFREDDEAFRETTREELFARVASHLPGPEDIVRCEPEMTILKKAIRNNSRGVSLRNLFDKIPNLLPKLCPCMLMSPLSVSQYLQPENGQFDLVLFDEASQLPTSEAVASIARGKKLIVVGDPKQLPPTSFFEVGSFDEENVDKEDLESILDECIALSLPSVHLKWHYRSRHESLIAFSNANYYDNSLLTFPSNDDLATRVSFRAVNGLYDRGRSRTNEVEADAIVEEVKRRLSDPKEQDRSIGIVTFNVSQKNLIDRKLDELFQKNKALSRIAGHQAEQMFVKSLENVQGDERDVILFSIGYGVDHKGRVSLNFGPLNQDGGWRRLNVAVSRARYEMVVFSSLQPEQIVESGFVPRGVTDLKAFMKYARDGREALEIERETVEGEDSFAEKIAVELRAEGYTVHTGIGSSDFKVDVGVVDPLNPGNYLFGILLDGPEYASAEAARDREIIRPQVLEWLGWTIRRNWILDRYDE
ncbi:MAG: DUF4011 domain-containing protein [Bacteroidales bacterium]|nr:DUF4011 domain-containing protein [Bacteroidales bacterium]